MQHRAIAADGNHEIGAMHQGLSTGRIPGGAHPRLNPVSLQRARDILCDRRSTWAKGMGQNAYTPECIHRNPISFMPRIPAIV
jgi:hypothetical protein